MVSSTLGQQERERVLKLIEEKAKIEKKIDEFGEILQKVKLRI